MVEQQEASFVLVEGVNIYNTLYDTSQLSVIRGGSFLLKQAVKTIEAEFSQLEAVSTGASRGVFKITSSDSPSDIVRQIQQRFNQDDAYKHFSIMVASARASSVQQAEAALTAKIRWQQQLAPSLVPDEKPAQGFAQQPCDLEGRRAKPHNAKRHHIKGDVLTLSESVAARLKDGRERRRSYYHDEITRFGISAPALLQDTTARFAEHFEELTAEPAQKLSGKMAVMYFDGNSFGSKLHACLQQAQMLADKQNSVDKTVECQQSIDKQLQTQRAQFLSDLLQAFEISSQSCPNPCHPLQQAIADNGNEKVVRIETLLWGGDEMMFVLPAWLGWDVLQLFYQQSADWKITGPKDEYLLTHAGGIVFCSHKTPIRIVQTLARELAERVKEQKDGREHDAFDYVVLEAIDYPTESSPDAFFGQLYGPFGTQQNGETSSGTAYRRALRPVANWPEMKNALSELIASGLVARSQLYTIAQRVVAASRASKANPGALEQFLGNDHYSWQQIFQQASRAHLTTAAKYKAGTAGEAVNESELVDLEMRLLSVSENSEGLFDSINRIIFPLFNTEPDSAASRAATWLHLVELWDYLIPQLSSKGEQQ